MGPRPLTLSSGSFFFVFVFGGGSETGTLRLYTESLAALPSVRSMQVPAGIPAGDSGLLQNAKLRLNPVSTIAFGAAIGLAIVAIRARRDDKRLT